MRVPNMAAPGDQTARSVEEALTSYSCLETKMFIGRHGLRSTKLLKDVRRCTFALLLFADFKHPHAIIPLLAISD